MGTLKVDTVVGSDGTSPVTLTKQEAAKVWINLDAVSSNAIRDSLNVSSVTDLGAGEQRWSFVNNMNNAYFTSSYSVLNMGGSSRCGINGAGLALITTGQDQMYSFITGDSGSAGQDNYRVASAAHGDLA